MATTTLAALFAVAFGWSALGPEPPDRVERFQPLEGFQAGQPANLLPDGSGIVFRRVDEGVPRLWLRRLDNLSPVPIAGTEGVVSQHGPEVSPDGERVAFIVAGQLQVTQLLGGVVRTLSDDAVCCQRWGPDGFIYYRSTAVGNIDRVPADGGTVEPVTQRDGDFGDAHGDFQVLPDSDLGVFMTFGPNPPPRIVAQRLSTGERRVLVAGMKPFVTPTGHLLFASLEGQIMAAAFDARAMELTSDPTPMVQGVAINASPYPRYSVSESGDLLYQTGAEVDLTQRSLVWVDRDGREEPIGAPQDVYVYPRISPDGRRMALETRGEDRGFWIWNFDGETLTRLLLGDGTYEYPLWTPNGERIAYGDESRDLYWKASNNTGVPEMLAEAPGSDGSGTLSPYFFTPDGAALVFRDQLTPETDDDLIMISVEADATVVWRLAGDFIERNAELSPDGRWMAYQSDESGEFEVYVRPFPQVEEDQVQVSNNGGGFPLWSRDGRELFYLQPGVDLQLMSVLLDTDETDRSFAFRDREVIIEWPYFAAAEGRSYDVSLDGQRFMAITAGAGAEEVGTMVRLIQVTNWFEELRERVPN